MQIRHSCYCQVNVPEPVSNINSLRFNNKFLHNNWNTSSNHMNEVPTNINNISYPCHASMPYQIISEETAASSPPPDKKEDVNCIDTGKGSGDYLLCYDNCWVPVEDISADQFSAGTNKSLIGSASYHAKTNSQRCKFPCTMCSKGFSQKALFIHHLRTHTGEKPYSCKQCNKSFFSITGLRKHDSKNHPDSFESCNQCNRRFRTIPDLTKHSCRGGKKFFSCEVCDKSFCKKSVWKRHMKIHHEPKSFQCERCLRFFRRKDELTRHVTNQLMECTKCGQVFCSLRSLSRHIQQVHGQNLKKYECSKCGKSYRQRSGLHYHMKRSGVHSKVSQ